MRAHQLVHKILCLCRDRLFLCMNINFRFGMRDFNRNILPPKISEVVDFDMFGVLLWTFRIYNRKSNESTWWRQFILLNLLYLSGWWSFTNDVLKINCNSSFIPQWMLDVMSGWYFQSMVLCCWTYSFIWMSNLELCLKIFFSLKWQSQSFQMNYVSYLK